MLRQLRIERYEAESVVKISQSINESWVSVFDDRSKVVLWGLFHVLLGDF